MSAASYVASLTPPIGVAYLASSLRNSGHDVNIVDSVGLAPGRQENLGNGLILRGISFNDVLKAISSDVELIGFSGMFSSEWVSLKPLVDKIGNYFPNAKYIAGGEHFSAAPKLCLEQCPSLDAIVIGEGEETIIEIADAIDKKTPWNFINGLVYRDKSNSMVIPPQVNRPQR